MHLMYFLSPAKTAVGVGSVFSYLSIIYNYSWWRKFQHLDEMKNENALEKFSSRNTINEVEDFSQH